MSVEDSLESSFIQQNIEILQDEAKSFWIGIHRSYTGLKTRYIKPILFRIALVCYLLQSNLTIKCVCVFLLGEWMWIDNTVVDYINWAPRSPNSHGNCVEAKSESGLWMNSHCSLYRGYICKTLKSKSHSHTHTNLFFKPIVEFNILYAFLSSYTTN